MNLEFSELQSALAEQASRFLEREYTFAQRRTAASEPAGFSAGHWRTFADLGWLGLLVPEGHEGIGGGHADVMVLMEAMGRGLVVEPYLASAVLATTALAHAPNTVLAAEWLPRMARGEARLALAYAEAHGRYDPTRILSAAQPRGPDVQLLGRKSVVLHAEGADALLLSVRQADGLALYLVPAATPGLLVRGYGTADGLRAADVEFALMVPAAQCLAGPQAGDALLERALDAGCAALCAEAVGCMQALLDRTLEYLRTRVQFGKRIGEFQVLQHRAVDMYVALEEARSLAMLAALKMDAPASERRAAVSAAKQRTGVLGHQVGESAVQAHGGIGVTEELDVAHYFKRLTMIDHWLGDSDFHLDRFRAARAA